MSLWRSLLVTLFSRRLPQPAYRVEATPQGILVLGEGDLTPMAVCPSPGAAIRIAVALNALAHWDRVSRGS